MLLIHLSFESRVQEAHSPPDLGSSMTRSASTAALLLRLLKLSPPGLKAFPPDQSALYCAHLLWVKKRFAWNLISFNLQTSHCFIRPSRKNTRKHCAWCGGRKTFRCPELSEQAVGYWADLHPCRVSCLTPYPEVLLQEWCFISSGSKIQPSL